jgi:hypothetical protein
VANGENDVSKNKQVAPPKEKTPEEVSAWVNDVLMRAQRGDKAAHQTALEIMRDIPSVAALMEDIADAVRGRLIDVSLAIDKNNLLLKEAYKRKAKKIERQLLSESPAPLEKLLCERIATCYLAVELAELDANVGGVSLTKAAYYDKRLTLAHKRYMMATESLARIRRLQLPVQQINIAQPGSQQMNVATSTPMEALPTLGA